MINGIRFIIGSGCNYNCFYCHHEGVKNERVSDDYKKKIDYISKYCEENLIRRISVTGGEPFLYAEELFYILSKFNDEKYSFSINTNATLIEKYIPQLLDLKCSIELHINFSSLIPQIHQKISGTTLFPVLMKNVMLLKNTKIKVCLNSILLKGVNDDGIMSLLNFCEENGFLLRLLQYLPSAEQDKPYVINEKDLKKLLPNLEISDILSYGIFKCILDDKNFEFVKNLCCDKLCDRCKKYTFVHFTPSLDIKMCMNSSEKIIVDYSRYDKFKDILDNI